MCHSMTVLLLPIAIQYIYIHYTILYYSTKSNEPTLKKCNVTRQKFSCISARGLTTTQGCFPREVLFHPLPHVAQCCSTPGTPAPNTWTLWTLAALPTTDRNRAALPVRAGRQSSSYQLERKTPADPLSSDRDASCKCLFWNRFLHLLWFSAFVLPYCVRNQLNTTVPFFLPCVESIETLEGECFAPRVSKTRKQLPDVSSGETC